RPVPWSGLAGRALLVVDDLDAAPVHRRRRLPGATPVVPTALHDRVPGGRDEPRRELCGAALRLMSPTSPISLSNPTGTPTNHATSRVLAGVAGELCLRPA